MATFFKICPPAAYDPEFGGRRADSENYLRLAHSESEILWIHLDDPDIEGLIRGLEINGFFIDQAEQTSENTYDTLCSRLGRWDQAIVPERLLSEYGGVEKWPWKNPQGKPLPPVYALLAVNPDAETHWIYRRFHPDSKEWRDHYSQLGYKMITMRSDENKYLPKQNLDEMLRKDESFIRRFVRAEWGIPEGQIHNVRPESIISGNPAVVAYIKSRSILDLTMDHGDAAPTCCVEWATDRNGNIFGLWEYYEPNLQVSEHRKNLKPLMGTDLIQQRLADPSMFYKTMQKYGGRYSFADDYSDRSEKHGFKHDDAIDWTPADNDEMGTRNLINEYLRPQGSGEINHTGIAQVIEGIVVEPGQEFPRIHPINGQMGYWPRLFFVQKTEEWPIGLDHVIQQTRSQRRVRTGTDMGKPTFSDERDMEIKDHAYDPLRYMIASRRGVPTERTKTYSKNSFFGKRDELMQYRRQMGWNRKRVPLGA